MPDETTVASLAEVLSWTSGEFTRYDPDAHPDHNRWSWRGDGHGEVLREGFREQARAILASPALADLLAKAWDEGYDTGDDDCLFEQRGLSTDPDAHEYPHKNPYRAEREAGE